MTQYMSGSRNFLMPNINSQRKSLVHKGRDNIINFLNKLPKTKHDFGSFVIDAPFINVSLEIFALVELITEFCILYILGWNGSNCC